MKMNTPGDHGMSSDRYFSRKTLEFLRELKENNEKHWFEANRERYIEEVRNPALRFIEDFRPHLKKISPHFKADARPSGGSLFRIYRDTRFSKDKSPYKTHIGIQFRHLQGRDVHAPGFYLHIEPDSVYAGLGIWHPESETLRKIREAIVEDPAAWKRSAHGKRFLERFELSGESLKRPPRDFDPDHPLVEDLKRKDFVGSATMSSSVVLDSAFLEEFADICRAGAPLVKYLCKALELPY